MGRVSIAPALSRLLEDPEPIVRVAAIHALANLCHRVQRGGLGRSWLGPLADDAHAEVRDAATTALAELPA